ncbi:MAG: gliding motility-associated protein GldE [Saprospiraceae bacterium]
MESESIHLLPFDQILLLQANISSLEIALGFLGIFVLLMGSALISGAEIAFFSLSGSDQEALEQSSNKNDERILYLKDFPRFLLATILVSNNFINIAIIVLSNFVLTPLLPESQFETWANRLIQAAPFTQNIFSPEGLAGLLNILILTVGVTFLLVLFGEVTPKVYARMNNLQLARFMATPLKIFMRFFHPVNFVLVKMTGIVERKLSNSNSGSNQPSREEIDEAIELTVSKENESEQEVDILKSIVKFGEVSVTQIMRSRVDVIAVDFRIDFHELLSIVRSSGFSRIPVYDEEFDNVTGILYAKDLLGHLNEDKTFEWQHLIRTNMLYVPEAKKIDDLLKDFQRQRLHMAIVVDEYGGSSGIVTLEDIMEEIIGDIKDEFDNEEEVEFQKIDDYQYIFEGKTLLNDVCRIIGVDTSTFDPVKGDSDSLAGLVLELYGGFLPKDAEIVYENFHFKAVSISKRRIQKILLTLSQDSKYFKVN